MEPLRIVVPVKQVPETGKARMDEESGTIKREGVESIVNPLDLYAIETALRIRQRYGGEITALSMGPPSAHEVLREAIAMGCDGGVLLSGRGFVGSDTFATAYALSRGVRRIGRFDLVICGERATDGETGQVGPGLAALLDVPPITYVSAVEDISDGRVRVRRLVERGYETLSCTLPCVVSVIKEIADPRLPTLRGKRRARAAEIPTWGPADVGAAEDKIGLRGSPTRVVKIARPRIAREGEVLAVRKEEDVEPAVERMAAFLEAHLPGGEGADG